MTINLLALIHGITPQADPKPREQYQPMLRGLHQRGVRMDVIVEVEWGQGDGAPVRPDQHLTPAERHVGSVVSFERVKRDESPQNHLSRNLFEKVGVPGVRWAATELRERIVQLGLTDAVYYSSAEGEQAVRSTVYQQVLGALEPHRDAPEVRLHLIGHSLGVTLAHDFLYGLFAPGHAPDFRHQAIDAAVGEQYATWRERAQPPQERLRLGTLIGLASQLPVFLMRRQNLVARFARGDRLDPTVIGIRPGEQRVRLQTFYDVDDILGFATRPLYAPTPAIVDHQVQTGFEPWSAHTHYFGKEEVIDEVARLLATNAG
jgi:hypothetical protein